jgi:hypothetical protein
MNRLLDDSLAEDIANLVIAALTDEGYHPLEIVPGLIQAVVVLAEGDDRILDAAANFLADGGVE